MIASTVIHVRNCSKKVHKGNIYRIMSIMNKLCTIKFVTKFYIFSLFPTKEEFESEEFHL